MIRLCEKYAPRSVHQERTYRDGRVNLVLSSDRVRSQKVDNLNGAEAGVTHARKYLVVGVRRLRDEQVGRWLRDVRTTSKELEARATGAVGDSNGTSELDTMGLCEDRNLVQRNSREN